MRLVSVYKRVLKSKVFFFLAACSLTSEGTCLTLTSTKAQLGGECCKDGNRSELCEKLFFSTLCNDFMSQ